MHDFFERLVRLLLETKDLVLSPDTEIHDLVRELIHQMPKNERFVPLEEWIGQTLTQSERVEELYASDGQILSLIREL